MEKKPALFLSFALTLLIALDIFLFAKLSNTNGLESAIITRVIDGDTLELADGRVVRLANINSPEKGQRGYNLSIAFLKKFENTSIRVEIIGQDLYKRNLGRVYAPDYINLRLVSMGFAGKFLVANNEEVAFASAEDLAIENSFGIWSESPYSGCFSVDIDKREEVVYIGYLCKLNNSYKWRIKDEGRKIYYFALNSSPKLTIHSGKGKDNLTDIFIRASNNIWNNDRDTIYLFDEEGKLAYHFHYGY